MKLELQNKLKVALQAVQKASLLVKKIQQEMVITAIDKEDRSPVTIADFASQAVIAHMLNENLPDLCLVGEEDSANLKADSSNQALKQITSYVNQIFPDTDSTAVCEWIDTGNAEPEEAYWTVDPIDGTKGFLRGDQYAIALAYVEQGEVKIGVLGCPNIANAAKPDKAGEGSLLFAVRGEGCWYLPLSQKIELAKARKITVSNNTELSTVAILRSFERGHTNADQINQLAEELGITNEPIRMDSQAKYALLAGGTGEIILRLLSPSRPDYKEKIWDQAAGSIILEEAGGKITDLSGKALDFSQGRTLKNNRGILATNGFVHEKILNGLKELNI